MWHFVVILLCKQYFPEEKWGKAHETRKRTHISVKERENVVNPFGMFSVLKKDLQSEGEKCDTCEWVFVVQLRETYLMLIKRHWAAVYGISIF